jgi:uncharacterized protein YkwD
MRRQARLIAAFLLLWGLNAVTAQDQKTPPKWEITADEKAILDLTNKARVAEKLPPLKPNAALFQAARSHTENMAKQQKMEHELDGKRVGDRAKAAGYDYKEVGENIAEGENVRPEDVVKGWLESKPHRENMLKPDFTEIGLGVAKDAKGHVYYTQVFGLPRKK